MDIDLSVPRRKAEWGGFQRKGRSKVLLREPEACRECNRIYISLYALKTCADHEGLDEL